MDDDSPEQQREASDTTSGQSRAAGEPRQTERHSDEAQAATSAGFVWGESVEPSDGGFEWGGAVDEPAEAAEAAEEGTRRGPDADDPEDVDDGLTLDPTLVTTTRGAGIDDEAVSLLAAFRDHRRRSRDRNR